MYLQLRVGHGHQNWTEGTTFGKESIGYTSWVVGMSLIRGHVTLKFRL